MDLVCPPSLGEGGAGGGLDGLEDFPFGGDEAGMGVVSGAEQGASVFHGPHDGLGKMLSRPCGFPVPAVVGDGGQELGALSGEGAGDSWEGVLEADIQSALEGGTGGVLGVEGKECGELSRCEVPSHADEVLEPWERFSHGDVFPEGDQVHFIVVVCSGGGREGEDGGVGGEEEGGVEDGGREGVGGSGESAFIQGAQEEWCGEIAEEFAEGLGEGGIGDFAGEGAFRPEEEVRLGGEAGGLPGQGLVFRPGVLEDFRGPHSAFGDISLDGGDVEGCGAEGEGAPALVDAPEGDEEGQGDKGGEGAPWGSEGNQVGQEDIGEDGQEGDAVGAGEGGQEPGVGEGLGGAQGVPGESGEEPSPDPFQGSPRGGGQQGILEELPGGGEDPEGGAGGQGGVAGRHIRHARGSRGVCGICGICVGWILWIWEQVFRFFMPEEGAPEEGPCGGEGGAAEGQEESCGEADGIEPPEGGDKVGGPQGGGAQESPS